MKQPLTLLAVLLILTLPLVHANAKKKKKPPAKKIAITCPTALNHISDCPDTGCGKSLDPLLNQQKNTDVHIVLVSTPTLKLKAKAGNGKSAITNTLKKREAKSQTVEYTPRVRDERNEAFDGSKLKDLIDPKKGGKLKVRVTGLLLYDSEHALGGLKLLRRTDWEIHPVFRLEFCPKDKTCLAASDTNWVDINK